MAMIRQFFCHHNWLRARLNNGEYGLRCGKCLKENKNTFNSVMAQSVPTTEYYQKQAS